MPYDIETSVEIPDHTSTMNRRYPLGDLEIGQSFFMSQANATPDDAVHGMRARLDTAAHYYGKRNGRKYKTQKMDGGVRCWRTE